MNDRHLRSLDKNDLYDDVREKKALPELILKQNILNAQDSMLLNERLLMNNYRSRGSYYKIDIIQFQGSIVLLFGFLKQMIRELLNKDQSDIKIFNNLVKAEQGDAFSPYNLVIFKNFLLKYLHRIGITNLFLSKGKSFEDELEDDF